MPYGGCARQRLGIPESLVRISVLLLPLLAACGPQPPLEIGFIGGLTGRVADLGASGRDGALLAVEEHAAADSGHGRALTLVVRDDRQDSAVAAQILGELASRGTAAVIGPMTSAMALAAVPVANARELLLVSPTTSANELSGLRDHFFRLYPPSRDAAMHLAQYLVRTDGLRTAAVVYDVGNRAHTEGWFLHFRKALEAQGGRVTAALPYTSGPGSRFLDLARSVVREEPDAVLVLANALDTAILCQQFAKLGRKVPVVVSEWSATEDLLRYGGRAVEGLRLLHTFDPANLSPRYVAFRKAFAERFGHEPGFAAVHSYDATRMVIEALGRNPDPSALGKTILEIGTFHGLQGDFSLDAWGDVRRTFFLTEVRGGRFQVVRAGI